MGMLGNDSRLPKTLPHDGAVGRCSRCPEAEGPTADQLSSTVLCAAAEAVDSRHSVYRCGGRQR